MTELSLVEICCGPQQNKARDKIKLRGRARGRLETRWELNIQNEAKFVFNIQSRIGLNYKDNLTKTKIQI